MFVVVSKLKARVKETRADAQLSTPALDGLSKMIEEVALAAADITLAAGRTKVTVDDVKRAITQLRA